MDYLLSFFKQDPSEKEFQFYKPRQEQPIEIESSLLKSYLIENLPQEYWLENSNHFELECKSFSSFQDIFSRINELEKLNSLSKRSFFYEIEQNSNQFSSGLNTVQSFSSLLTESEEQTTSLLKNHQLLRKTLAENYLKLGILNKRQKNLETLIKKFLIFEEFSFKFLIKFKESLENKNFFEVLKILTDFQEISENHEIFEFKVFQQFKENLSKNFEKVNKNINEDLEKICLKFDSVLFGNLVFALITEDGSGQVSSAIKLIFDEKVDECFLKSFQSAVPHLTLSSTAYMIKITPVKNFIPLISEIFSSLTNLMFNYHQILSWFHSETLQDSFKNMRNSNYFLDFESVENSYQKLFKSIRKYKKKFCKNINEKIISFFEQSNQIGQLQHGELRQFSDFFSSFLIFFKNFSEVFPEALQNTVLSKLSNFLISFHHQNWLKVVNMLEVEKWEQLPIPKTFNLQTELSKNLSSQDSRKNLNSSFSFSSFMKSEIFSLSKEKPENFSKILPRISIESNAPIFSMTGMNILKILRNYMDLISVLSPLSFEVFHYLTEILDFYVKFKQVFEIFHFFSTSEWKKNLHKEIPPMEKCEKDLSYFYSLFLFQSRFRPVQIHTFRMKDVIETQSGELDTNIKNLHSREEIANSMTKALVALESYKNILKSLESIKVLQFSLAEEEFSQIERFLTSHSELSGNLSCFILEPLLKRNLELSWLRPFIEKSKWSEETYEGKSGFVIKLVKYFKEFCQVINDPLIVPSPARLKVLELLVSICFDEIIESFSLVSHFNTAGRNQMRRDLKSFWKTVKKIVKVPRPKEELEYLQVWEMEIQDVVEWVLENPDVSFHRQMRLLKTLPQFCEMTEKEKNKILRKVEKSYLKLIFL